MVTTKTKVFILVRLNRSTNDIPYLVINTGVLKGSSFSVSVISLNSKQVSTPGSFIACKHLDEAAFAREHWNVKMYYCFYYLTNHVELALLNPDEHRYASFTVK